MLACPSLCSSTLIASGLMPQFLHDVCSDEERERGPEGEEEDASPPAKRLELAVSAAPEVSYRHV